jgi:hypothetical protein
MQGVTLFSAKAAFFKGRQLIEGTRFGILPEEAALALDSLDGPHNVERRPVFAGLNRFCGNYFHILTQIIPAIAGYRHCPGFPAGVLLVAVPAPVLLRGLQLTGIETPKPVTLSHPRTPLDICDLTYSSILSDSNMLSPLSLSVFDGMIQRAEPRGSDAFPLIYVRRSDSAHRPMRNEDDLVEHLFRNFGVQPVVLSKLSLDDQIGLFQNARMVIGPHGAGLANIVFARPGTILYELLPDHYINPCVNQLAQLRQVHYWCDVHPSKSRPDLWRHDTAWSVDIQSVERRLTAIFARYNLHA